MINECYIGDTRDGMSQMIADGVRVQCVVTSPPYYGLRDYGTAQWDGGEVGCDHVQTLSLKRDCSGGVGGRDKGTRGEQPHSSSSTIQYRDTCGKCGARRIDAQIGLESTPAEYIATMVDVFRLVRELLADDGTVWCNMGDSYANDGKWGGHTGGKHVAALHCSPIGRNKRYTGLKPKDLIGIPWRLAFALQADGWYLRSDIIWAKPNPMPESVRDRPTKSHEYVFLLTKKPNYFYDADAVREGAEYGRRTGGAATFQRVRGADPNDTRLFEPVSVTGADPSTGRNKRSVWTIPSQPFTGWSADFDACDYVSDDGKPYKASADCVTHAHLASRRTQQKAEGDAQLGFDQLRKLGTDARLLAKHAAEAVSKSERHSESGCVPENTRLQTPESNVDYKTHNDRRSCEDDQDGDDEMLSSTNRISDQSMLPVDGSGCSRLDSLTVATSRNRENRRMDRAPETILPCNPCVQTSAGIERIAVLHGSAGLADHTSESKNAEGSFSDEKETGPLVENRSRSARSSYDISICRCVKSEQSHFATFPEALVEPCILAGSRPGDIVFDPFMGSGTVARVAQRLGRSWLGCELSGDYVKLQNDRTRQQGMVLA